MRKLVSVVHISLDGFVAGINGELDNFPAGEENLEFVCGLTREADAALIGRISYEMLNGYWPSAKDIPGASKGTIAYSNWYNTAQKIVVSKTMSNENSSNTIILNSITREQILDIKKQNGRSILIFGSPSVTQALLDLDLVDEHWIFINPVLFKKGIPLFKDSGTPGKLKLVNTHTFPNGELAIHYVAAQ